ncbi:hypothetical protein FACS1894202_08280 [Clostridia bacterium]|nr:hypothetical protein FACS1894202_08280 [Clostridia bacterium]
MTKKPDHQEIVINRAVPTGVACDVSESDCCEEELLFGMRDKYHEFSIGLSTVLTCLKFAESEGRVPPLPVNWWVAFEGRDKE